MGLFNRKKAVKELFISDVVESLKFIVIFDN